jgi:hypothetical protein
LLSPWSVWDLATVSCQCNQTKLPMTWCKATSLKS